jgi:putative transposase
MLLQLPATVPVARAANVMKGGSSRVLRREHPELEEFLWGDSFWQDGYFAETIGRANEATMRNYIKSQREREAGTSPAL